VTDEPSLTLFGGHRRLASGSGDAVAKAARAALAADPAVRLLVFDDRTGRQVDLDLRPPAPAKKAGRPKLGVVSREVTLLPRHWDWLAEQPGGASVALRRLIEAARRDPAESRRAAHEAAYRVLSALAGDLPGFEEACRALFADDREGFQANTAGWPGDVRDHALGLLGWA